MVLGSVYDYLSDDIAMTVAGLLLLVVGIGHLLSPSGTVVAQVIEMFGVTVTNDISNVFGIITRIVGFGVGSIGFGMLRDQYM